MRRLLVVPAVVLVVLTGSTVAASAAAPRARAAYQATCARQTPYKELEKDATGAKGRCVSEKAQVFQYTSKMGTKMLVDVTATGHGIWDTVVEVHLDSASLGQGVSQDDIVKFWGPIAGKAKVSTQYGGDITVPVVDAKYVTLVSAGATTTTTMFTT